MSHPPAERVVVTGEQGTLGEVVWLALTLGFTAFGGPAAHIATLRGEMPQRQRSEGPSDCPQLELGSVPATGFGTGTCTRGRAA